MNKEKLKELGIETDGQTFGNTIAIFKKNTMVLLFNILGKDDYEVHHVSEKNFNSIKAENAKGERD